MPPPRYVQSDPCKGGKICRFHLLQTFAASCHACLSRRFSLGDGMKARTMVRGAVGAVISGVIAIGSFGPTQTIAQPYPFSEKSLRAWILIKRGEYQQALAKSEAAVVERPNDPVALAVRGTAQQYLGRYDLALADHDLVLKITPDDPGALTNACWVRAIASTQLDLALTYCDQAVSRSRKRAFAAYDARGFLHLRRAEFELARADYDKALSLRKKLASSLFGRGIANIRLGNEADGRADLATATRLEPSVANDYLSRGISP